MSRFAHVAMTATVDQASNTAIVADVCGKLSITDVDATQSTTGAKSVQVMEGRAEHFV